jgi:hypothetical protein
MKRPGGIIAVSVLMCLGASLLALGSVAFFVFGEMAVTLGNEGPMSALFAGMGTVGAVIFVTLAVIYTVLAISLWQLRWWARGASIAFIGLGLLFAVLGILRSLPHPLLGVLAWQIFVIVVDLGILSYLSEPHVVRLFAAQPAVKPPGEPVVKTS